MGGTSNSAGGRSDGAGGEGGQSGESGGDGNAADGGANAGAGGNAFVGGTRLVIPRKETDIVSSFFADLTNSSVKNITGSTISILDAPDVAHEHKFSYVLPAVIDGELCTGAMYHIAKGHLEVDTLDVSEDLNETGAHLTLVADGDGYLLRHDGLGRHGVDVTGRFVPDEPLDCPDLFNEEGVLPVSFHDEILVVRAASAQLRLDWTCSEPRIVLSGQGLRAPSLVLLDSEGASILASNIDMRFPISVVVETEHEATITPPTNFSRDSVLVTGPAQRVRLSTELGTLVTYDLVAPEQVDDWEVQFWVRGGHGGIWRTDIEPGGTYGADDPAGADGVGAVIKLLVQGKEVCSLDPTDKFVATSETTGVCLSYPYPAEEDGPVIDLLSSVGVCTFDLAYPEAKGGDGLNVGATFTFVAP